MKNKFLKKLFLFSIFSLVLMNLKTDGFAIGENTAEFLRLFPGARPSGMGGAFTGVSDDINAFYWNPAGFIQLVNSQFSATYVGWLEGISNINAGYVHVLKKKKFPCSLGASIDMVNFGELDLRDTGGNPVSGSAMNMCMSFAAGFKIERNIGAGVLMKSISQKYGQYSGSAFGLDLSGIYILNKQLTFGVAMQNLGTDIKIDDEVNTIPLITRIGCGYRPKKEILLAFDFEKPNNINYQLHLGIEYSLESSEVPGRVVYLRTGYNQIGETISFDRGISVGVGYISQLSGGAGSFTTAPTSQTEQNDLVIDYSAVLLGESFGIGHRLSVGLKFK